MKVALEYHIGVGTSRSTTSRKWKWQKTDLDCGFVLHVFGERLSDRFVKLVGGPSSVCSLYRCGGGSTPVLALSWPVEE